MKPTKFSIALTMILAVASAGVGTTLASPGSRSSNLGDEAGQPLEKLDLPTLTLDVPPASDTPEELSATGAEPTTFNSSGVEEGSQSVSGTGSFSASQGGGGNPNSDGRTSSSGSRSSGGSGSNRDASQLCGLPANC